MLPVVAMILSVVGLCVPPLLVITGLLGVYCYFKAVRDPAWAPRKQIAQMTMAVSGAGLLIFVGLLLPNFKRYQLRVKQMECQKTLALLHGAQSRFYEKQKRYTTKLSELDWQPPRGRDILRLSPEGPLEEVGQTIDEVKFPSLHSKAIDDKVPKVLRGEVGVRGDCPACSITMLCATELDGDDEVDVWTVSTIERIGSRGEKIPGGIPWCELDDVGQ